MNWQDGEWDKSLQDLFQGGKPMRAETCANNEFTWESAPTGSCPCNRPWCKTYPIHHPTSSFTNLSYPITTHSDCKSMILIYQLQCIQWNACFLHWRNLPFPFRPYEWTLFHHHSIEPRFAIHTQYHQITFQECRSVIVLATKEHGSLRMR